MIRLRITADGRIRGLWTDAVDFTAIGHTRVRRASHVEFDERRQMWYVREAVPRGLVRRCMQFVGRRPLGRILVWAPTRQSALEQEAAIFGLCGNEWPVSRVNHPAVA
ncbi:MAG: hypothetical protein IH989_04370 [Planctomycetes bacterium]|nr:hypothetical protein [Planctomycetota bacterium]